MNWISNDKKKENRERIFYSKVKVSGTKMWGVIIMEVFAAQRNNWHQGL